MKKILISIFICFCSIFTNAQTVEIQVDIEDDFLNIPLRHVKVSILSPDSIQIVDSLKSISLEDENGNLMQVPTSDGQVDAKWQGNAAFVKFLRENPVTREHFEKLLDEKLLTGKVGVSISQEEIDELEQMNLEIEEIAEVAATK